MLAFQAMNAFVGVPARAVLAGCFLALAPACSKVSEASSGSAQAGQAPLSPSSSTVSDANYGAKLELAGPCHSGGKCAMNVVLVAKGDYHINDKYPYKFRAQDPPARGVVYTKPIVGRDDGVFEEKKAVLVVPFVADAPGEINVGGTLSLSVCSKANCLMDKQMLEATVKVE
jgi:hypothetical protein